MMCCSQTITKVKGTPMEQRKSTFLAETGVRGDWGGGLWKTPLREFHDLLTVQHLGRCLGWSVLCFYAPTRSVCFALLSTLNFLLFLFSFFFIFFPCNILILLNDYSVSLLSSNLWIPLFTLCLSCCHWMGTTPQLVLIKSLFNYSYNLSTSFYLKWEK